MFYTYGTYLTSVGTSALQDCRAGLTSLSRPSQRSSCKRRWWTPTHPEKAIKRASRQVHLAHIESVCEDEDVGVELVGGEGKGQDLEVPDDPHPQEEPQVNAHCVHLLRPASLLVWRAGEKKELLVEMEISSLILEDVDGDEGKHGGVDDQQEQDGKVEPHKLAHASVEMATPEQLGGKDFI